jgi:uncharacterized protein (TIGR03437 family)
MKEDIVGRFGRWKRVLVAFLAFAAMAVPSRTQTLNTVVTFNSTSGTGPNLYAPLVQGSDGNLYGTTEGTGNSGGTVFKLTLDGALTTLYSFPTGYVYDPRNPLGGVIQGSDGNFYGTTYYGGTALGGGGALFKVTPGGVMTTICSFGSASADGIAPQGGLVQATDGNFYGTTPPSNPGYDDGTVFRCTPGGTLTTLAVGNYGNGGRLLQATDGNLYGLTVDGGPKGYGTIFRISLAGTVSTIYNFGSASTDGRGPSGWLAQATDGNLYGVTAGGGTGSSGTFFKFALGGTLTTLHSFVFKTDGSGPNVGLIQATDGNFYGTTNLGGANNYGTIFKITPAGALTTLYSLNGISNAGLMQASDGKLYGIGTTLSGVTNAGTVFSLTLPPTPLPAPTITSGGIVPIYSSSTTIQPGEWVSIYGTNFASGNATWTGNFPTSLGGASVTINGKSAYLWFVSPGQINLQAPDDSATGVVPVVVTTSSGSSTSTVTLGKFGPSFSLLDAKHVTGIILRFDGSGAYGGGAYDILGPTGTSLGYSTVAAKAGDIIELFGVGFGPTTPSVPAGQAFSGAAPTINPVTLHINNVTVIPSFAGLSGAGLYQLTMTLPAGLGAGDVPLVASVGGVQTPSSVVISLQ